MSGFFLNSLERYYSPQVKQISVLLIPTQNYEMKIISEVVILDICNETRLDVTGNTFSPKILSLYYDYHSNCP